MKKQKEFKNFPMIYKQGCPFIDTETTIKLDIYDNRVEIKQTKLGLGKFETQVIRGNNIQGINYDKKLDQLIISTTIEGLECDIVLEFKTDFLKDKMVAMIVSKIQQMIIKGKKGEFDNIEYDNSDKVIVKDNIESNELNIPTTIGHRPNKKHTEDKKKFGLGKKIILGLIIFGVIAKIMSPSDVKTEEPKEEVVQEELMEEVVKEEPKEEVVQEEPKEEVIQEEQVNEDVAQTMASEQISDPKISVIASNKAEEYVKKFAIDNGIYIKIKKPGAFMEQCGITEIREVKDGEATQYIVSGYLILEENDIEVEQYYVIQLDNIDRDNYEANVIDFFMCEQKLR